MSTPDFPMPVITPRLLIRPPEIGDATSLNAAILDSWDSLHEWMEWAREKPDMAESERHVQEAVLNWRLKEPNEPWLPLFVFDKQTRDFIGATCFHHYNWAVPCLETGYWIRRTYAGKGLMTEAINAITQYAFKQLRVKRIAITCDVDNIRSRNIPERLHYVLEGVLKSNRLKPLSRDVTDTLIFAKYSLDNLPCVSVTWSDTK